MKNFLKRLWGENSGQDLTEYALLLVMLALFSIAGLKSFATGLQGAFQSAAAGVTGAGAAGAGGGATNPGQ